MSEGDCMKILISPSKTMHYVHSKDVHEHVFHHEKTTLLKQLKSFDTNALAMLYQSSKRIAEENYQRFQRFNEDSKAIFSYTGAQFKALDAERLPKESLDFLNQHLYIMSGLYGLVRPFDTIGLYRLPMGVTLDQPLKKYWIEPLKRFLKDDTILNLTSQEYSEALCNSLHIINVDFYIKKSGKLKKQAMEIKKQRGQLVKYLALKKTLSLDVIRGYKEDGYCYNQAYSSKQNIVFIRTA